MKRFKEKILETAIEKLEASQKIVSTVAKEEEENAKRLPGNLKSSKKYDKITSGADNLRCAGLQISRAIECIKEACGI